MLDKCALPKRVAAAATVAAAVRSAPERGCAICHTREWKREEQMSLSVALVVVMVPSAGWVVTVQMCRGNSCNRLKFPVKVYQ